MADAPLCPVHKLAMRPSNKGSGFYCSKKNPDGSYCDQRAAGGSPEQVAVPVPTRGSNDAAIAALAFAGAVYHGTGKSSEALAFAREAFEQITRQG